MEAELTAAPVDTHAMVKGLVKAGVPEKQAEAHVSTLTRFVDTTLATKHDLEMVRRELKTDIAEIHRDIAALRKETKSDIAEIHRDIATLRKETKSDIEQLRKETKLESELVRRDVRISVLLATITLLAAIKFL